MRALLLLALLILVACGSDATEGPGSGETPEPPPPPTEEQRQQAAVDHQQALRAVSLGEFDRAEERFEKCLAANPYDHAARADFGFVLLENSRIRDHGRALTLFLEGRALHPDDPDLLAGAGVAQSLVGNLREARPLLEQAVDLPGLVPYRRSRVQDALGQLEFSEGRLDEADRLLAAAAAVRQRPANGRAQCLVVRAQIAEARQDLSAAEALLRQGLALDPECVPVHFTLSRVLRRLGRKDEAEHHDAVHEVLRRLQDDASARFAADEAQRMQLAEELVRVYPEYRKARIRLIRELLRMGRYEEVAPHVAAQLERDLPAEELGELHFLEARACAGLGDLEGARTAVMAMREAQPEVPIGVLGQVLSEWGRQDESVTDEQRQEVLQQWLGGE